MRRLSLLLSPVLVVFGLAAAACSDDEADTLALTYSVPMQEGAYWPKFRRTADNSGYSPVMPGTGQSEVWSFATGKGIFSSPIIDKDGVIYIGSANAVFYAVRPDGKVKWQKKLGELVDSAGVLGADGTLYFGSGDGYLYAVDSQTGKEQWTFKPRGGAFITWFEGNVVMGPDGTLYAGNDDFHLYAIDPKTGKEKWSMKTGDQIWSAAAITKDNMLYVGSNDKYLYAVDLTKAAANPSDVAGKARVWRALTLGSLVSSPLVTPSGKVVFGSFDGYLHGYDGKKGTELFKLPAREHVYASAARGPDGTLYLPAADGTLYAITDAGKVVWTFDALEPIRSSPAVGGDGTIYFGCGDGKLYALNPDGTRRWSFDTSEGDRNDLNASPALGKDAVYIAGEDGKLWSIPYDYCLRKTDKRCTTKAGEDLPADGVQVLYISPGGSALATGPQAMPVGESLAIGLVLRKGGDTQDAAIDPDSLKVTITPALKHRAVVAANGSFLVIVPDDRWAFDTSYKVELSGNYLVGGLRLGNAVSQRDVGGTYQKSLSLRTAKQALSAPPLSVKPDEVPVLDLQRLAAPQPTMMPSYNQIGFDFMHLLVGVLSLDATTGKSLAWVVAARRKDGKIVVDPTDGQKILFPLTGTFTGDAFVWDSSSFRVEFGGVGVPMKVLRLGGSLTASGDGAGGLSLHATTVCSEVTFYGGLLKAAGLCNPKTDQLVVHGTALIKRDGEGGKKPAGLTAAAPTLTEATGPSTSGRVEVTLSGTLPTKDHVISVLLLDATTGKPLPINYSQQTKSTVDSAGKITGATLTIKSTDNVKKGAVKAMVIHDLYPLGTFSL